ncbi:MAG: 2-C-methyl-D-erythritol 4-phosphate cytidylyltransferase [Candidatus Omnitrophota bacterium]
MKTTAIVVAAGKGRRFKSKEKKPFVKLGKRPLVTYALMAFERSPVINDIILVVDRPLIKKAAGLVKKYRINKVRYIVKGGRVRSQSVKNGLARVGNDTRLVLIHDGVRPFVDNRLVKKVVNAAARFGAAILAHPVKPTIKVSCDRSFVNYTPERRHLWEAETPQAFRREIIESAYKKAARGKYYTDDAALVECAGRKVKIVKGDYKNIKITTVEDLKIAQALLRQH